MTLTIEWKISNKLIDYDFAISDVTIEFNVGITGEVVDAFVVEATPPNRFEKNALKYVRSWVYEPLRLNGVPTEVQRIETKVIYRLQN